MGFPPLISAVCSDILPHHPLKTLTEATIGNSRSCLFVSLSVSTVHRLRMKARPCAAQMAWALLTGCRPAAFSRFCLVTAYQPHSGCHGSYSVIAGQGCLPRFISSSLIYPSLTLTQLELVLCDTKYAARYPKTKFGRLLCRWV